MVTRIVDSGPSSRTVLVAHRSPEVRDRFAAALRAAQHRCITAGSSAALVAAIDETTEVPSLAVLDVALEEDPLPLIQSLRAAAGDRLGLVIFAGSVRSATLVHALVAHRATFVNEHADAAQILPALAPHLFPDNFNRRAGPRVAIGVPIAYQIDQTAAGATTLDVGRGGLAIGTMRPLAAGTRVRVRFRLPAAGADIEAWARVVWSNARVGMGLQFEDMSAAGQDDLERFVDREAAAS